MSIEAKVSTSFLLGAALGITVMWIHRRYTLGV